MSHLSFEEFDLIDDQKYRNYINSVDKALKNFEYTSEWADLISALGKLNKVGIHCLNMLEMLEMNIHVMVSFSASIGPPKSFQVQCDTEKSCNS